jgi:hypothetical protein
MKKTVTGILIACCFSTAQAQINFVKELNAIPPLQKTAKEAFTVSEIKQNDTYFSYVSEGKARKTYADQILKKTELYQAIVKAKGAALTAPATQAAVDFSDLNSPEMQAKIAAMSQEEKMKFAMEVRQRMNNNQNIQTITNGTKTNPALTQAEAEVGAAYTKLLEGLQKIAMLHHKLDNSACAGLCGSEAEITEACAKKIAACESKAAHTHAAAGTKNYADYAGKCLAEYTKAKTNFLLSLTKFDEIAATLPDADKAEAMIAVAGWVAGVNAWFSGVEKDGAAVIVDAKNNVYTKGEY